MKPEPTYDAIGLEDFEGRWQLERKIVSNDAADMLFNGVACWKPDNGKARYREEGELLLAGQRPMFAEREYVWTSDLKVFFPDGRFFHTVATDGSKVEHWCDPDTYIGRYNFSDWPVFSVFWRVTGPKKDYTSHTCYRRL